MTQTAPDFNALVEQLQQTHTSLQSRAANAVNQSLTLRNWLFGFFIVEYEQNGKDFAEYGSRLLYRIAAALKKVGVKGISYTNLTLCRKFYLFYPQIGKVVGDMVGLELKGALLLHNLQALPEDFRNAEVLSPEVLLSRLTFTHFVELLKVNDHVQRLFYEVEAIRGGWNYRQLQRQIGTMLYERTGLSHNKEALLAGVVTQHTSESLEGVVRDPYVFEFLGLKASEVLPEKELEKALLDHLQNFLLELGTGFCFEARQKSFLIDNRRYKVDLLFYHRVLKCHVMIDLKISEFTHEDAGQMNFYLNYHRDHEMQQGDQPPVGIILCSLKNEVVVKYATGSLDNRIFVSKYMLQLPDEQTLLNFLNREKASLTQKIYQTTGRK
jgi:predicted nuclease of restriction endonuclease-like (RecB) superfamily